MDLLARQRAATVAVWKADVAVRPAGDWADLGGLAVHTTGLPVRYWNGAHVTGPAGIEQVPAARAWFADRGMPWGLLVPAELGLAVDLPLITEQPCMVRLLQDLPPRPALDLRRGPGPHVLAVQEAAFGDELLEQFLSTKRLLTACHDVTAYDADQPVATGRGLVVDGVLAVYGVGTVPSHRRQGLGRAITLSLLHEGLRQGCDLAVLNPSTMGYQVYRDLGFTDLDPWRVYDPM